MIQCVMLMTIDYCKRNMMIQVMIMNDYDDMIMIIQGDFFNWPLKVLGTKKLIQAR